MKIVCNKIEFADLVRRCAKKQDKCDCYTCLFCDDCSKLYEEKGISKGIENLCEIREDESVVYR